MAAQADARPIIIKKVKKGGGDGHHGGAWKVAYADFVTAMMAFFMLMWLLNATTEQQRKGIADYFTPTIPINRVSGGGDGAFGGDSIFSENTLPRNGTGATSQNPTESNRARGATGTDSEGEDSGAQEEVFTSVEAELLGKSGESDVHDEAFDHIIMETTDEGLVFNIISLPEQPIFEPGTSEPTPILRAIAAMIVEATRIVSNPLSIGGHVPSEPIVKEFAPLWERSTEQATAMRLLLEDARMPAQRIVSVSGHADRELFQPNPLDIRNTRLEIILLRRK